MFSPCMNAPACPFLGRSFPSSSPAVPAKLLEALKSTLSRLKVQEIDITFLPHLSEITSGLLLPVSVRSSHVFQAPDHLRQEIGYQVVEELSS